MKETTKSLSELLISIGSSVTGMIIGLAMPWTYQGVLVMASLHIIAFICAMNAVLNFQHFKFFGKIILAVWFIFKTIPTPLILWNIATIKSFGFK